MLALHDAGYVHVRLARLHRRERGTRKGLTPMARDRTERSRRQFVQGSLALAGLGLLAGCGALPAPGQQPPKVPRIGYLTGATTAAAELEAFRAGLRELGYV